jgi:hypothetical protein
MRTSHGLKAIEITPLRLTCYSAKTENTELRETRGTFCQAWASGRGRGKGGHFPPPSPGKTTNSHIVKSVVYEIKLNHFVILFNF